MNSDRAFIGVDFVVDFVDGKFGSENANNQNVNNQNAGTAQQAQTRTCPKCGAAVPSTSNFCPNCGNDMRIQQPATIKCPTN